MRVVFHNQSQNVHFNVGLSKQRSLQFVSSDIDILNIRNKFIKAYRTSHRVSGHMKLLLNFRNNYIPVFPLNKDIDKQPDVGRIDRAF